MNSIQLLALVIASAVLYLYATHNPNKGNNMKDKDLNSKMEFDHVVQVLEDGSVIDAPNEYAPELHDGELETVTDWTLMNGYSGQYGYSGPIMHSSEFIGGGMERDILGTPGYYVALVDYPMCYGCCEASEEDGGECEPDGWAVAFKPAN